MTGQTTSNIDTILAPLRHYSEQVISSGDRTNPRIGSYRTGEDWPIITHAEYIKCKVLPILEAAVARFGEERVVRELIEVTLPAYGKIDSAKMAVFWDVTVPGVLYGSIDDLARHRQDKKGQLNADVAAEIGVKDLFAPIISLAMVYPEMNVLGVGKFFASHACRMGYVIKTFGPDNAVTYVDLARKLLWYGLSDNNIDDVPEHWELMKPAIAKYGFRAVLSPFINLMIVLAHVEGANDPHLGRSLLGGTLFDLKPYIIERVMEEGPSAAYRIAQPIVDYVGEMHQQGAFTLGTLWSLQCEFFRTFREAVPRIKEQGMEQVLKDLCGLWTPRLLNRVS